MKALTTAVALTLAAALPAAANVSYPIFAAECAGGVNQGGYNIDTDDRGHLWINGHKVNIEQVAPSAWQGGYHGVVFDISTGPEGLLVAFTGRHGVNGFCEIMSQQ
ncbi:MAG: hypothetical protein KJZ85_03810 [Rhodobacteraceae bacterium]|jgi:hypothetical protein|nr:hypothetical protein [Paracoccaceae bacterium]